MDTLIVAAAVALIAIVAMALMARQMRADRRDFARRELIFDRQREDLMNRVMYLSNHPWEAPPAEYTAPDAPIEEISYPDAELMAEDFVV
jgi:hypothetical protein